MKRPVFSTAFAIICLAGISFADSPSINIVSASLRVSGYGFAYYQDDIVYDDYDIIDTEALTAQISDSIPGYGYDASSSAWFGSAGDLPISSLPWGSDADWAPDCGATLSIGAFTESYTDNTGGDSQAYASARAAYTFTSQSDSLDLVISLRTTGGDSDIWFKDLTDNITLSYQYDVPIDPFSIYSYSNTYSYTLDTTHLYSLEIATQSLAFFDTNSQTQLHTALVTPMPEPNSLLFAIVGLTILIHIRRK